MKPILEDHKMRFYKIKLDFFVQKFELETWPKYIHQQKLMTPPKLKGPWVDLRMDFLVYIYPGLIKTFFVAWFEN